jgi:4,5-DOPA dioxygenase extradiol
MDRRNFLKSLPFIPMAARAMDLTQLKHATSGLKTGAKMPVLFIGHGSPMNALEDNEFTSGWKRLASAESHPMHFGPLAHPRDFGHRDGKAGYPP